MANTREQTTNISPSLLTDTRIERAYLRMEAIAPFTYERYQAEYYLRHLKNYLASCDNADRMTALTDLHSPAISYFTDMNSAEREAIVTDIGTLYDDPELVELSDSVQLASLEMNGGLGSSMGIDPTLNQSKATGIMFSAPYNDSDLSISVMGAKMLHATRLADKLGTLHLFPANSTVTEQGWQDFLSATDLATLPGRTASRMTNAEFLAAHRIRIHPSIIQQAFPRLDPETNEFVISDNPADSLAPGGHGQFLYHLYFSGKMEELAKAGTQVLVMANSDNINATPNPIIAAKMIRDDTAAALVSTDRTPLDAKGGIFVIKSGKLDIIEMGSVPKKQQELFTQIGLRKGEGIQPFNTNTIYINVPLLLKYLSGLSRTEGEEVVHALLMPETIPNSKPGGIQLEGAISSTVLKLPGARLFNASESMRSDEFTPLKKPVDVTYYLDSDAYEYDVDRHQLSKIRNGTETAFALDNWEGWNDLAATRRAFGRPSFKDLDSLTISGAISCPDAIWRGRVEVVNEGKEVMDLTQIDALQIDGHLTLDNVRVTKSAGDRVSVTSLL